MKSKNIRILLIDDDKSYCLLVKRALTKQDHSAGFTFKIAHSLAEGLKLLGAEAIDLVLLDLGLPDSFGLDTFDSVRNAAPEVSIVMLTGLEDEQVSIEAIKRGASDYLIKGKDSFADILVRTVLHALERKRTEQTLRVNERNFRNIINKSADAVIVTDENGIILFANNAVDSLFGWNSKELLGKSFGHPITTGRTCEIELTRKSGGAATAEMRVVETTWQGSRACFVSLHDITSRKATEKKMAKYRDNLKALIEERTEKVDAEKELLSVTFSSMGDGVIVVDSEKRIVLFNRVAEDLAGWEFRKRQCQRYSIGSIAFIIRENIFKERGWDWLSLRKSSPSTEVKSKSKAKSIRAQPSQSTCLTWKAVT